MGGNRGTEICSCIFSKLFARPRPPHPFLARTAPQTRKKNRSQALNRSPSLFF